MKTVTEVELVSLGVSLGASLPPGSVIWLEGPLGAGKTAMVRAIVRGRRGDRIGDEVTSPSYTLVHHYDGPNGPLAHVDCYRFRSVEEAGDLDWEELASADLLLIEWPELGGPWVPSPTVRIRLQHDDDPARRGLDLVEVGSGESALHRGDGG